MYHSVRKLLRGASFIAQSGAQCILLTYCHIEQLGLKLTHYLKALSANQLLCPKRDVKLNHIEYASIRRSNPSTPLALSLSVARS